MKILGIIFILTCSIVLAQVGYLMWGKSVWNLLAYLFPPVFFSITAPIYKKAWVKPAARFSLMLVSAFIVIYYALYIVKELNIF